MLGSSGESGEAKAKTLRARYYDATAGRLRMTLAMTSGRGWMIYEHR